MDRTTADARWVDVRALGRRQSTATVLLNHAVAERLGLGPTDHKCLDLIVERGPLTSTDLARILGVTTGAISGVIARLEARGFVDRTPDPRDGRRHMLVARPDGVTRVAEVFAAFHDDLAHLVAEFDDDQLNAIETFLARTTDLALRHAAALRAADTQALAAKGAAG